MATKTVTRKPAAEFTFMLSKLDVDGTSYEYKIEENGGRYRGHCVVAGVPLVTDWRTTQRSVPGVMVKMVREKVAAITAEQKELDRLRAWNAGLARNAGGGV